MHQDEAFGVTFSAPARNPDLATLLQAAAVHPLPPDTRTTSELLDELFSLLSAAHANPSAVLHTGLDDQEARELMTTRSVAAAVNLVRKGLTATSKLQSLPA